MKITIDGYFEEYCQDCPELNLTPSVNFTDDNTHYMCKNRGICDWAMKRLEEKMVEKYG